MAKNKHGLEYHIVANWLRGILADLEHSTPKECARELVRVAKMADAEATVNEANKIDTTKGEIG